MFNRKGTSLDLHKQVCELGLKIKKCRNIPISESTLQEKLKLDNQVLETDEQRAILQMTLMIKEKLNHENISEYLKKEKEMKEQNTLPDLPGAKQGENVPATF